MDAAEPVGDGHPTDSQSVPPTELVPDTAVGEAEVDELSGVEEAVPPPLAQLQEVLTKQGMASRVVHAGLAPNDRYFLEVDLAAGRSSRIVRIPTEAASDAEAIDFSAWRSLERYNAIWSPTSGMIEAVVRMDRFGPMPGMLLARLAGAPTRLQSSSEPREVVLNDPSTDASLRIGPASPTAQVLLASGRGMAGRSVTLTLSGIGVSSTSGAETLLEGVADAFMFECEVSYGASFTLARLEPREHGRLTRARGRLSSPARFPVNAYPHEPVMLFKAGRDRTSAPTIRYWALYQVLEYFFPKYSLDESRRRLTGLLRDPRFDVHSDDDITNAVLLLSPVGRGQSGREQDQLDVMLRSIVNEDELRGFIHDAGLEERLADRKSPVSNETVSLRPSDDVRKDVGRRVYDIRCKIVHSKSESERESGAGLIPGSHHDDMIREDLALIEFLAEKALIAAAERPNLRPRGG